MHVRTLLYRAGMLVCTGQTLKMGLTPLCNQSTGLLDVCLVSSMHLERGEGGGMRKRDPARIWYALVSSAQADSGLCADG